MRRKIFNSIAIICLLLCSIATFASGQTEHPVPIRIACVGDSITFGMGIKNRSENIYPAQLATMLGTKWAVRNFGVNGATLLKKGDKPYWKTNQFEPAHEFKPDIVIIKLGTNDTRPVNWKHKAEYVSDYIALIKSFQEQDNKPEVWICYPVPAYGRWRNTDQIIKKEILPLIDVVARQAGVKNIDLYTTLSNKKEMFADTLHPNSGGAKLITETIYASITGKK